MTSIMRDYGVAALKRRPNVRFCRIKSAVHNGLEPWIRLGEGHAGHKTLWICRCAWTTLPRRPQLHRAHISKHCLMKQKKELRLSRRTSEATGSTRCQATLDLSETFADAPIRLPIHIAGHIIWVEP